MAENDNMASNAQAQSAGGQQGHAAPKQAKGKNGMMTGGIIVVVLIIIVAIVYFAIGKGSGKVATTATTVPSTASVTTAATTASTSTILQNATNQSNPVSGAQPYVNSSSQSDYNVTSNNNSSIINTS